MTRQNKQKDTTAQILFGLDEEFTLEHQCFNAICFFLGVVMIFSSVMNIFLGLGLELILGAFGFGALFGVCYYLSRFRRIFYTLYWIVFGFGCAFVELAWFFSGGISGTATIISINILAVANLILGAWRRLVSVVIVCGNLGVLFLIEYRYPDMIIGYDSNLSRFIDIYFTFFVAILIITFVIHFTMEHFRSERIKVKDREEKLKAIVDNMPDSVWLKDTNNRFTMVNKPFSDNCGVPMEQIIGKKAHDIWPRELADQFNEDDLAVLSTGTNRHRNVSLSGPDDQKKFFEILKQAIINSDGETVGIVGIAREITARYQYEERLKKYEQIVDTSKDQMALVNRSFIYEAANQSYIDGHGGSEAELIGKKMADVHSAIVFEEKIRPNMEKAFKGEIVNYQDTVEQDESQWRHDDVSYYPYKNIDGETVNVVVHIRDITEVKQMETRLLHSEKMEAIGTLAGGIAHDFNNILSGILGYAQLGKLNLDDPGKMNRHLDQIIKGSQRAGELIRQILTFSRQYDYEKQPIQTALIVKEVLKLIRATIPTTIDIVDDIDSDTYILADPSQIHQIVMNLCTNAYHAMIHNPGVLTVRLTDRRGAQDPQTVYPADRLSGPYQLLEVSDTGQGIDEQTMEKIFDPYFTTKEMDKGTGLGLALVQGIVEELKGTIRVESTPQEGSVFRIYLPIMKADEIVTDPDLGTVRELPAGEGRIMVVDDETSILFSTQELLEDCGYRVDGFLNGRQALDEFIKAPGRYDLVITDMTMPKLTGDALSKELLKLRPDLPIILCTGYSDQISEKSALKLGVCRFVQKPLVSMDLAAMIREILGEPDKTDKENSIEIHPAIGVPDFDEK